MHALTGPLTGYYLMIAGSIFSWMSQQIVALSFAKAKYMALSDCSCQCVEIRLTLLKLFYFKGSENPADMFMKNLSQAKSVKFQA